jgi:hypothetical protein
MLFHLNVVYKSMIEFLLIFYLPQFLGLGLSWPFLAFLGLSWPLFHFFVNFLTQLNFILLSSVLLSCCHIHTIGDILDCGTLLSPELEQLTQPERVGCQYALPF